jgi:PAS domain S-box-containing protein
MVKMSLKHPQLKKMAVQQTFELPDIDNLLTQLSIEKEAEIVLRESEERLNVAMEATGLGLWDYDVAQNITKINANYARMLGYEIADFVEQPGLWWSLIHPDDAAHQLESWDKHLMGITPVFNCIYRIRAKSGEWKWIHAQAKTKQSGVGDGSLHFIGTHKDITQQAEAEQKLQLLYKVIAIASEVDAFKRKLQKILECLLEVISNHSGTIHLFNPDHHRLELFASQGVPPKVEAALSLLSADKGLWGRAFSSQKPFMLAPGSETEEIPAILRSRRSIYGIAFPIMQQEKPLGVLFVYGHLPIQPNGYEYQLIGEIAAQIGAAYEKETLRIKAEHTAVIEERQRLARELHDSLSQSLYSLALTADGALDFSRLGDHERVEQILTGMTDTIQQTLKEMRLLVYELRPSSLEREGLEGALHKRLDMVEQRARMRTVLSVRLDCGLSARMEAELYGIAQEALNNVLRHSGATQVTVSVSTRQNNVFLEITDNGQGFKPDLPSAHQGIGLASMRERTENMHGQIEILSEPGNGTRIRVQCPIEQSL